MTVAIFFRFFLIAFAVYRRFCYSPCWFCYKILLGDSGFLIFRSQAVFFYVCYPFFCGIGQAQFFVCPLKVRILPLLAAGVDCRMRNNAFRKNAIPQVPRDAEMKRDHVVICKKPQRPDWMSEAEYVLIPAVLELREILYIIHRAGQQDEVTEVDWFSWRENRLE